MDEEQQSKAYGSHLSWCVGCFSSDGWDGGRAAVYCTCVYCMFIPHPWAHNIDLQSADSAALNLPSQLQAVRGSAPTLASAECHRASHSPSLCRLSPANRRCVGGRSDTEGADSHNPPGETSINIRPASQSVQQYTIGTSNQSAKCSG